MMRASRTVCWVLALGAPACGLAHPGITDNTDAGVDRPRPRPDVLTPRDACPASCIDVRADTGPPLPPTHSWELPTQPPAVNYSRTGTVYVFDTPAHDHIVAMPPDAWATHVTTAGTRRLRVTPPYRNLLDAAGIYWRQISTYTRWTGTFTVTADAAPGPDDAMLADRVVTANANAGPAAFVNLAGYGVAGGPAAFSFWVRRQSGSAAHLADFVSADNAYTALTSTAAWQEVTGTRAASPGSTTLGLLPSDGRAGGGIDAGARDVLLDMAFVVAGSALPYRTAGECSGPQISKLAADFYRADHRFDNTLFSADAIVPASEPTSDSYLFASEDMQDSLRFRVSDRRFVLRVNNTDVAQSNPQNFVAGVTLGAVRVWSTATDCGFELAGLGVTVRAAASPARATLPARVFIAHDGGGRQFPMDLYGSFVPHG